MTMNCCCVSIKRKTTCCANQFEKKMTQTISLPQDLIIIILSYLPIPSPHVYLVNKSWFNAMFHPSLWQHLSLKKLLLNSKEWQNLISQFPSNSPLPFKSVDLLGAQFCLFVNTPLAANHIQELNVYKRNQSFERILQHFTSLKSFNLYNSRFDHQYLIPEERQVLEKTRLEKVSLLTSDATPFVTAFKNSLVEFCVQGHFTINSSEYQYAALCECENLKTIKLPIPDRQGLWLRNKPKHLQLKQLLQPLKKVETLTLKRAKDECDLLSDELINVHKSVKAFTIHHGESLQDDSITLKIVNKFEALEHLKMANYTLVGSVSSSIKRLEHLVSLNVCLETSEQLFHVLSTCKQLKKLKTKCQIPMNESEEILFCNLETRPCLQELRLHANYSAYSAPAENFSPYFISLILSKCPNLKALRTHLSFPADFKAHCFASMFVKNPKLDSVYFALNSEQSKRSCAQQLYQTSNENDAQFTKLVQFGAKKFLRKFSFVLEKDAQVLPHLVHFLNCYDLESFTIALAHYLGSEDKCTPQEWLTDLYVHLFKSQVHCLKKFKARIENSNEPKCMLTEAVKQCAQDKNMVFPKITYFWFRRLNGAAARENMSLILTYLGSHLRRLFLSLVFTKGVNFQETCPRLRQLNIEAPSLEKEPKSMKSHKTLLVYNDDEQQE